MKRILIFCLFLMGGLLITNPNAFASVTQEAPVKETKAKTKKTKKEKTTSTTDTEKPGKKTKTKTKKKVYTSEQKEINNKAMDYEPEKDPKLKGKKVNKEEYKMKPVEIGRASCRERV